MVFISDGVESHLRVRDVAECGVQEGGDAGGLDHTVAIKQDFPKDGGRRGGVVAEHLPHDKGIRLSDHGVVRIAC